MRANSGSRGNAFERDQKFVQGLTRSTKIIHLYYFSI